MIHGIGVDIVKTERMKTAVERWGRRFLEKIFTDREVDYSYTKKDPYLSLAARFAAKEALIKASGFAGPFSFREIEILNSEEGRPSLEVKGRLKEFFSLRAVAAAHVSLSHEREYAVACVVLEV